MPNHTKQLLEQYLDGALSAEEAGNVEALLAADPIVKQEFQVMKLAIEAIKYAGLKEQVAAIHQEMRGQKKAHSTKPATVVSMTRWTMRIAAGLLFFVGAIGVYKYMSVSSQSVYQDYYQQYELGRTRGSQADLLETAFRNKNWNKVIDIINAQTQPDNKSLFLSGIALLETGNTTEAINKFNTVITSNASTGNDYFNDEAEYYLALSHIRNNDPEKATSIIQSIKKNKSHLYHPVVIKNSGIDLKLLNWKSPG